MPAHFDLESGDGKAQEGAPTNFHKKFYGKICSVLLTNYNMLYYNYNVCNYAQVWSKIKREVETHV